MLIAKSPRIKSRIAQESQGAVDHLADIDGGGGFDVRGDLIHELEQRFLVTGQCAPGECGRLLGQRDFFRRIFGRAGEQLERALQGLQFAPNVVQVCVPASLADQCKGRRIECIVE
jgi:hypothetical protein